MIPVPHRPRLAVLDDFHGVANALADWSGVQHRTDVEFFSDHVECEALVERLAPFDAVVLMRERTPLGRALIGRLPRLKAVFTTGMRNLAIDLDAADERGIVVCGTDSASSTAELALGLMIAASRQIVAEDRALRSGRWQTVLGRSLQGRTLGIVGLGKLGAQVAGYGRMLGMHTIAWSDNLTQERAAGLHCTRVEKQELFARADVVSLHLVLSARTRGVVGAAELSWMKPDALIVNTARAGLVDMDALVQALHAGRIGGAAIDVYDHEPLPPDAPILQAPRTVLTPHLGYATRDAYSVYYTQVVEAVEAWLDGRTIRPLQR